MAFYSVFVTEPKSVYSLLEKDPVNGGKAIGARKKFYSESQQLRGWCASTLKNSILTWHEFQASSVLRLVEKKRAEVRKGSMTEDLATTSAVWDRTLHNLVVGKLLILIPLSVFKTP